MERKTEGETMGKLLFAGCVLVALVLAVMSVIPLELRLVAAVPVFAGWCAGARLAERWIGGGR